MAQTNIHIVDALSHAIDVTSTIVAEHLVNPRGLQLVDDDTLLLIEAGSGNPRVPDGRLVELRRQNNGRFERAHYLLEYQPSINMLEMMKRDEIMGLADFASNGKQTVVSLTDYIGGSKIIEVAPTPGKVVFDSQGNLNSICYHPDYDCYFAIKPDANVVVAFSGDEEKVIAPLNALSGGQDAVPVCVVYEPKTKGLLVSLFSGEIGGHETGQGIDFDKQAGQVVRVDIESGSVTPVITGLCAPTGIALDDEGKLYVLELCDDFLEPLVADDATKQCLHGGFKRFSGRLLLCDLANAHTQVIATGLDTPSNLVVSGNELFISEGMGMSGRPIPGPDGQSQSLMGFVRQLSLKRV